MSEKSLLDIDDAQWEIVRSILRQHVPEREVWAFDSRVRWTAKKFSDLGLAVLGDTPLTHDEAATLSEAFANSDLPWKVDVVDLSVISEAFRKIIELDKKLLQNTSKIKR